MIEEGHLMPDHIHMRISVPPKYAVSNVSGYLKGKRQFQLLESSKVAREITRANIFGLEVILFRL